MERIFGCRKWRILKAINRDSRVEDTPTPMRPLGLVPGICKEHSLVVATQGKAQGVQRQGRGHHAPRKTHAKPMQKRRDKTRVMEDDIPVESSRKPERVIRGSEPMSIPTVPELGLLSVGLDIVRARLVQGFLF